MTLKRFVLGGGWKNETVTYQKGETGVRDLQITLVEVTAGTESPGFSPEFTEISSTLGIQTM